MISPPADYPLDIKAGVQHLDGATALEFVRERHAFAQQDGVE
jgi:anionic cell wall polymer biosynthesis LytR-Cps2A-Psr (LCP) family protein